MMDEIKISFAGDLMCLQQQNESIFKKYGKYDYSAIVAPIINLFDDSDYVVANLETPIGEECFSEEQICFNTPPSFLDSIKSLGVDFLMTCNNHCLDRGIKGLDETLRNVNAYEFDHSGTYSCEDESNRIFIKDIRGIKFAFICCTFGTNSEHNGEMLSDNELWRVDLLKKQNKKSRIASKVSDAPIISRMIPDNVSIAAIKNNANGPYTNRIRAKINEAKQIADKVIVLPHIGGQYNPAPGFYTKHTINWMAEEGCDLIVAGHPHVPLRTEFVKDVFTAYSLGNFLFTPGVGYYLPNVLSEYGIILHTFWSPESKCLTKVTFNIVKNVVDEDGISCCHLLYDLIQSCGNAIERDFLSIDNEAIVNRFIGNNATVDIQKEYTIFKC